MKIIISTYNDKTFSWTIEMDNGKIIAEKESYLTRANCWEAAVVAADVEADNQAYQQNGDVIIAHSKY